MSNSALVNVNGLARALVGFELVLDDINRRTLHNTDNYPPYNIARYDEFRYEIVIAVTGFNKSEILVEVESSKLTIRGVRASTNASQIEYIHRGLALRDFEKQFTLAEHIKVKHAETKNGVLSIQLVREVPEECKPRIIDIVETK